MNYVSAEMKEIRLGDKVYVRVVQEGIKRLELMMERVGSMTDLIGEIRYAAKGLTGLTKVFIRNHSRGWSTERPMKFYADGGGPRMRKRGLAAADVRQPERRMLFPWEM